MAIRKAATRAFTPMRAGPDPRSRQVTYHGLKAELDADGNVTPLNRAFGWAIRFAATTSTQSPVALSGSAGISP
jgi:hypothetical protein